MYKKLAPNCTANVSQNTCFVSKETDTQMSDIKVVLRMQCMIIKQDISLMGWPANRLKICLESSLSMQTAPYI